MLTDYNPTPDEMIEMVEDINNTLQPEENCYHLLEFRSIGHNIHIIEFLGNIIWSSVEDERKHNESDDSYEDLKTFVINAMKQEIDKVYALKHLLFIMD